MAIEQGKTVWGERVGLRGGSNLNHEARWVTFGVLSSHPVQFCRVLVMLTWGWGEELPGGRLGQGCIRQTDLQDKRH